MNSQNYFSLQKLWESLHELFLNAANELRHRHLLKSKMSDPKDKMDIWGKLGGHLDSLPLSEDKDDSQQSEDHQFAFQNKGYYHYPDKELANKSGNLGEYYQSNISTKMYPHVSDQMHRSAMDHINKSFYLAKKGDKFGAKLHVELAESAVHTASRFMTEEQYSCFEKKMLTRIEDAINFVNPDLEASTAN
ncbi:MAG: hypothetical protein GY784_02700 [Gammaproteobacteria bacterium]|nr:hypothetical protein [Gammaproteobacteria bacterium]